MKSKFSLGAAAHLFSAAVLLISTQSHAFLVDKIAAIVNNEVILTSDIDHFERTISLRRELDPLFGFSAGMEGSKPSRDNILEFKIQEKLIGQTFRVSDQEVNQEIQIVQRNNRLSQDDLVGFLNSKGFKYEDYFELMRVGLQKRRLLDLEIRSRANISDDDVRNFYYNNVAKNSTVPLEYHLSMVTINFKTYKNLQAAEKTAREALGSIRQGESFAEVAKRISDDSFASQGGDLGFISSENLAEALQSPARKLQIGTVSDLIRTQTSFIILKLNDFRSMESQKLIEIKEQLREQLAKEEYKKQLYLWAERARNNAYVHIN